MCRACRFIRDIRSEVRVRVTKLLPHPGSLLGTVGGVRACRRRAH